MPIYLLILDIANIAERDLDRIFWIVEGAYPDASRLVSGENSEPLIYFVRTNDTPSDIYEQLFDFNRNGQNNIMEPRRIRVQIVELSISSAFFFPDDNGLGI